MGETPKTDEKKHDSAKKRERREEETETKVEIEEFKIDWKPGCVIRLPQ